METGVLDLGGSWVSCFSSLSRKSAMTTEGGIVCFLCFIVFRGFHSRLSRQFFYSMMYARYSGLQNAVSNGTTWVSNHCTHVCVCDSLLLWSVSLYFFFIRFLFFYFLEKHKNVHLLHIICYICSFHMSRISSYYLLLQFSIFDNYLLNQYLTRLQNMHTNEHLYTIRIAWNIWAVLYISWY